MNTNVVLTNTPLDCAVTSLTMILMHSNRRGNCLYWEWVFYSNLFPFKFLAGNAATVIIFSVSINIILSKVGVGTL